jgi:hypothetical protein
MDALQHGSSATPLKRAESRAFCTHRYALRFALKAGLALAFWQLRLSRGSWLSLHGSLVTFSAQVVACLVLTR